jgi:hypothetical protein
LFINLETGLAFYRGNVLRNIIYRDNINNTFFADRGLSHRIGELNLNVFYGFIISNKKSFPLLLLGPTLKLGLYDFNTVYTIEQSQQSLNNNWDDDDDFRTEFYRKTLIVSAGWHVTPGVKLRFYPLRHFIFLDFQASYSFGSNFRFMNYNQAGSPDQGFIAVRTSNHPNAFTEWVGNVFEANINLLQLKLGFGINIFSFRKKGNVTLD